MRVITLGKGRIDPRATPATATEAGLAHQLLTKIEFLDIVGSKYGNMFSLVLLMIISPNIPLANGQQGIVH